VTAIEDTVKRWCQEESLSCSDLQESDATLACVVTLPGDPPRSVEVREFASHPGRILVSSVVQMPLPDALAGDADAPERFAALLERVAASRSSLVDCVLLPNSDGLRMQISASLYEEGMSKQSFLAALEEVRKVERVIGWELESMAATMEMMSDVHSRVAGIVARTEALASDAAGAVAEAEDAAAAPTESAAPVSEPVAMDAPPVAVEPEPAWQEGPPPQAERFCTNCGAAIRGAAKFCRTCGARLED
jgi:hypothetical protein